MSAALFYHKKGTIRVRGAYMSRMTCEYVHGACMQASVGKHTDTRNNLVLFNFRSFLADFSNQKQKSTYKTE